MKLFDYSEIKAIAAEMSQTGAQVTPAQVLISWGAIGGHSGSYCRISSVFAVLTLRDSYSEIRHSLPNRVEPRSGHPYR